MKKLEITTNKRLLIVEYATEADYETEIGLLKALTPSKIIEFGHILEFICSGSELTEEIAEGMVEIYEYPMSRDILGFEDYSNKGYDMKNTALESFISAIEAAGKTWGNPVQKPDKSSNFYFSEMSEYFKAENNAYHPERVIIFEIVEG